LLVVALVALGTGTAVRAQAPDAVPTTFPDPKMHLAPVPPAPPHAEDEPDPWIYPPADPLPGFYADLEAGVLGLHVKNRLNRALPISADRTDVVHVPTADLDFTVSPRVTLGYRLPRGLGEFEITYGYLSTTGTQIVAADPGAVRLHSRFTLNSLDIDYAHRVYFVDSPWDMRWRAGVRVAGIFADDQADFAPEAGDISQQRQSNYFVGAGPFVGFELARRLPVAGLSLYSEVQGASIWGHLHQTFSETLDSGFALAEDRTTQAIGEVQYQAGLRYVPPAADYTRFFLGYEFSWWPQFGRNENNGSRSDFYWHGLFLRGEINF
jgi:hypothetical protein